MLGLVGSGLPVSLGTQVNGISAVLQPSRAWWQVTEFFLARGMRGK